MASVFGVQCHVYCNTGGIITTFGFIGSMGWLFLTSPWKEKRRVFLLMFAALCGGASIGPLLELVKIDPGKIIIAFVGSAIGFVSFSLAAMSSQNRARFYLLGLFSSDLLNLIWLLRASTYGGYSALFMLYMYLYFELLLSYLVFNSQGIIVQARCGDVCYVHHALTFFTDFPAVVIGLIRNKKKLPVPPSEEQKRRRGGRSRL
ncbi:bax inhibitor 1-like isoform X2 [Camellia sinensis]|uniref:bax inhibitor 1-like isoform X2 n=1 Tax=Camellia sinensis TaxID=4442 RepID=UPI0010369E4E|nr:bax inhibitor 1-like isoform X2 [Camellia sinensis]XP_028092648.1 bax inhibitor 1-like isoform X2 [Camellia sinensis]